MERNFINTRMIAASILYNNFINRIHQNDDGSFSNNVDLTLNSVEKYDIRSNQIFLDLIVANLSLLMPIFLKEYLKKVNKEDAIKRYPDSFKKCTENYQYKTTRKGNFELDSVSDKTFKEAMVGLRNALEHGLYDVTYDNDDGYINFRYKRGKEFIYKRIPVTDLVSMCGDMFAISLSSSDDSKKWFLQNRLALGIINNLKLMYQQLTSKHTFNWNHTFLEGNFFKIDSIDYLYDMKCASAFVSFYVYFQKHLEIVIGPMLREFNKEGSSPYFIPLDVMHDVYLDLAELELGALMDAAIVNYDVIINFSSVVNRYDSYYEKAKKFFATDLRFSDSEKEYLLDGISKRGLEVDKYKNKLNIIHHIRNAFAHGWVAIKNGQVTIKDYKSEDGSVSYECTVSIDEFEKIISHSNLNIIADFINTKKVNSAVKKVA